MNRKEQVPLWLTTSAGWAWRLIILAAAILAVFKAVSEIKIVFIAIFVGLVLTALLRPLVNFFSRRLNRWLSVILSMLIGGLAIGGVLTYVVFSVVSQWSSMSRKLIDGLDQTIAYVTGILPFEVDVSSWDTWVDKGQEWVSSHSGEIFSTASSHAGSVVEVFTLVALAIFLAVFFLAQGPQMWSWFLGLLPKRMHGRWENALESGWGTFSGYTRGVVIIAATDAILAVVLLLILGVPLAAPLAVLVFIGAFIPLIGAPGSMVIAMVVALASNGPLNAILVGLGIALIGQIEGHVLQPLVMGKQVALHPVAVALCVAAGTLIGGIVGAVVAVPLVAVAWSIFTTLRPSPVPSLESEPAKEEPQEYNPADSGV